MIWESINGDMFDFKDYYEKVALELPSGSRIAECGVADGKSAIFLAERMAELGKDFEFYFIDSMDYGGAKQITEIVKNISRSQLGNSITLLPISSLDAAATFNDNFFEFVFLDTSHQYMQTKEEIQIWWRKVKNNCILAGHDYNLYDGVKQAVNELIPRVRVMTTEIGNFDSLKIYETSKKFGIWEARKNWQVKLHIEY
jgi:cephalosporin hydroxylase